MTFLANRAKQRADKKEKARKLEERERQRTMTFLANRAKQRADKKEKARKLEEKRTAKQDLDEAAWLKRANKAIFDMKEDHEDYLDGVDQAMADARQRKQEKKEAARQ